MDPTIIVALIGMAGSIAVAVLNQKLTGKVKMQQREITWLKALIRLVVSDYERSHLRSLASSEAFLAEVRPHSTFEWELRHLVSLGLVARHPDTGIGSLFAHAGKRNVKEHLFITQQGRDYLRIVDEANAHAA
jgi:hypothetical protein